MDASLCHQVKTGHRQTEGPRGCVLYTLGNIFTLVDPVTYKEVAKQHAVPKRDQKHFLLYSAAAESSHPPGPISSFPNKGRKWLHPHIALWTHESVLWNLVSLGVSVYSSRLLPQGEKGKINIDTISPYSRCKAVGFSTLLLKNTMNE